MVKVTNLLILPESALGFRFGVLAQMEMKIWCVKCMHAKSGLKNRCQRIQVKVSRNAITSKQETAAMLQQHGSFYGDFGERDKTLRMLLVL